MMRGATKSKSHQMQSNHPPKKTSIELYDVLNWKIKSTSVCPVTEMEASSLARLYMASDMQKDKSQSFIIRLSSINCPLISCSSYISRVVVSSQKGGSSEFELLSGDVIVAVRVLYREWATQMSMWILLRIKPDFICGAHIRSDKKNLCLCFLRR